MIVYNPFQLNFEIIRPHNLHSLSLESLRFDVLHKYTEYSFLHILGILSIHFKHKSCRKYTYLSIYLKSKKKLNQIINYTETDYVHLSLIKICDWMQPINVRIYISICHLNDVFIIFSSMDFSSPGQKLQHWLVSCICVSGGHVNWGHIICAQVKTPSLHVQFTQPVIEKSPCSTILWLLSKQFSTEVNEMETKKCTKKERKERKWHWFTFFNILSWSWITQIQI